jgi:hypothetical protein
MIHDEVPPATKISPAASLALILGLSAGLWGLIWLTVG